MDQLQRNDVFRDNKILSYTVCLRSLDHFYRASCNLESGKNFWTNSSQFARFQLYPQTLKQVRKTVFLTHFLSRMRWGR